MRLSPNRLARSRCCLIAATGVLLGTLVLAGCGSGSGGGSSGGGGNGGGSGDGGNGGGNGGNGGNNGSTLEPTLASIQQNVFTPICTACHIGANAPAGLRLDEANSYGLLVGVASFQQPSTLRVAPGAPDDSYLIRKLEGTAATGARMPLDGTPLPQADIAVIRQWITDGAQPTQPDTPPSEPISVTSLSPLPDSTLDALPPSIIAIFARELDATSVSGDTFSLSRSGGDGTFDDGNETVVSPASVAVPLDNPSTAVMDLSGVPTVADTYRVRLAGAGPVSILDLDGQALDGEFDGTFPSGDGTEGGDFIAELVVADPPPSLQSIQASVFTPICSACHTGPPSGTLPAGLDLSDADASFDALVGVASIQQPQLSRVAPGDPDASYLVQKIEGTAAVGAQMPFGLAPLDDATIAAVREWITLGAERGAE